MKALGWLSSLIILTSLLAVAVSPAKLVKNLGNQYALRVALVANANREAWAKAALNLFRQLQSSGSKDTGLQMQIAEIYLYRSQWDQAYAEYTKFLNQHGDPTLAIVRLQAYAVHQEWCETEQLSLLNIVSLLSDKGNAYNVLGNVCHSVANRDAAIVAYRKSQELSNQPDVALKLAWTLFERAESNKGHDLNSAMIDYQEIIQVLEQTPPGGANAHRGYYSLAWSYWQFNQFEKAITAYKVCLSTPGSIRYSFACALNLGYAYSAWLPEVQRDWKQAEFYFSQAEMMAFDDAGRTEAQQARQRLKEQQP